MATEPGRPPPGGAPGPQSQDEPKSAQTDPEGPVDEDASARAATDGDGAPADKDAGRPPADEETAPAPGGKGRAQRKRPFWRDLIVIVVAALVLTILLKEFVVQVFSIPSGSMENTLLPGDRVLVNKLVYRFRGIARGDIVVFSGQGSWGPDAPPPPGNPLLRFLDDVRNLVGVSAPGTDYIKRVIGLPGDHVVCCDAQGRITVNGVPLTEQSYIYPGQGTAQITFSVTVPPGRLWVMGDNRGDSDDSRLRMNDPGQGTIPESAVVGRAFVIIWPVSRITDLPIPSTFQQPALHAAAAAATASPAVVGGSSAALAGGVLAWRRRRTRRPD
jgi:signal peptidase I